MLLLWLQRTDISLSSLLYIPLHFPREKIDLLRDRPGKRARAPAGLDWTGGKRLRDAKSLNAREAKAASTFELELKLELKLGQKMGS